MSVRYSPEHLADDIIAYLRTNFEAALVKVRTERADPRVATPKPLKYYISEYADPRETPAVFVVIPEIDNKKDVSKANYICAESPLFVSVVVEDQDTEVLTRRIWRYTAALAEMLDGLHLTGPSGTYSMIIVVNKERYSKLYTNAQAEGDTSSVFRLEGVIECQLRHFEKI